MITKNEKRAANNCNTLLLSFKDKFTVNTMLCQLSCML